MSTYVFKDGPLDGHTIEMSGRACVYRDATGAPKGTSWGDRRVGAFGAQTNKTQGGCYVLGTRPMAPIRGYETRPPGDWTHGHPGVYEWQAM